MKTQLALPLLLVAALTAAPSARAGDVTLELLLGFASEDYSFGLGLRGGVTLDEPGPLYLGGYGLRHFGESVDAGTISVGYAINLFGGEVGWDFDLDSVRIRPTLILGVAVVSASVCALGVCESGESSGEGFLALGGSVVADLSKQFYLGGELRFFLVGEVSDGFGAYAVGGFRF